MHASGANTKSVFKVLSCYMVPILIILAFVRLACFTLATSRTFESSSEKLTATSSRHGSPSKEFVRLHASPKYAATRLGDKDNDGNATIVTPKIFDDLIIAATSHPRKRKMVDLTKDPMQNSLQILMNTWTNGSFSPVHMHEEYSEAFVVLKGSLAFFTFDDHGGSITCTILLDQQLYSRSVCSSASADHPFLCEHIGTAIIVEKGQWHAMTAAPPELNWPGYAIAFENSGHVFDPTATTKVLAPFAPIYRDGMNGDPYYFEKIMHHCPVFVGST